MMTVMRKLIPWMLILILMTGVFAASAAAPLPVQGQSSAPGAGQTPVDHSIFSTPTGQGNGWKIYYHSATGRVRFMGGDPNSPLGQPAALQPGATPEAVALGFLATYGEQFGLRDPGSELVVEESTSASGGRNFVRFQQVYQGIPVMAGELIVQMGADNNVISANGEVAPDLDLSTTPLIGSLQASQVALQAVARSYSLGVGDLEASQPELWIYSPPLLGAPGVQLDALAWQVEVKAGDQTPVRELVLVDARLGAVLLHFNQVQTAKYRLVYDNSNLSSALPGNGPVRVEGGPASSISDVENAYTFLGDSYDFFASRWGRDSIDGMGMKLVATTRYCPSWPCPYDDSFWNGSQMVFGRGYASADDVVGHELAHGVMQYEANLFYYMQSGAINESFSDIWGEFIDLTYITISDTLAVRWQIGEDLTGGAIRNMQYPTLFNNPDLTSSTLFTCDPYDGDQGGVHNNSGIGNKAAYLMVDGDTFNGVTVSGIGLEKTAQVFYEAQTNLLTSGADYADLGTALVQACLNLVGVGGIGPSDCDTVDSAVQATEMLQQPANCAAPDAPLCGPSPDGGTPTYLFRDDFENPLRGSWSTGTAQGSNYWFYPQSANPWGIDGTYATSGAYNLWGWDQENTSDTWMAMNAPGVSLPASPAAFLHFSHAYQFDTVFSTSDEYFDGAVLEYSTDNGSTWQDAGGLPSLNGYNGALTDTTDNNPLETRPAFVGNSHGMISSRYDLSPLAGSDVRFRFRIGTGSTLSDEGWFIDDVKIYTCANQYQPQQIYLPLVLRGQTVPPPSVHISFNGSSPGWSAVNGAWLDTAAYFTSEGLAGTWASASFDQAYSNLTYEARLKRAGCATCENALILRGAPGLVADGLWQDGYYFIYTADGQYAVRKVVGGSVITLKALTVNNLAILEGQEWNVLRVRASGSNLEFRINGYLVWSGTDSSLASGQVGLGLSRNSASQWDRLSVDWVTLSP